MEREQQYCLRWNNFQANITSQFETLRDEEDFVDVTLACDGKHLKAHKVVLSACSPYFKDLFKGNPCQHPIVFMRDVEYEHLVNLLEFMYSGEVNVSQANLPGFLKTAEALQIRGLAEAAQLEGKMDLGDSSGSSDVSIGAQPMFWDLPKTLYPKQQMILSKDIVGDNGNHLALPADLQSEKKCSVDADGESQVSFQGSDTQGPVPTKVEESSDNSDEEESDVASLSGADRAEFQSKLECSEYGMDFEGNEGGSASIGNQQGEMNMSDFSEGISPDGKLPGQGSSLSLSDLTGDSPSADNRKLHSLDPRPCPICNRVYSNLSNLRQHFRLIHTPQSVTCSLCGRSFKTDLYLKRHLSSFHELASKKVAIPIDGTGTSPFLPPPPPPPLLVNSSLQPNRQLSFDRDPLGSFNVRDGPDSGNLYV